jgi:hypothetical protein
VGGDQGAQQVANAGEGLVPGRVSFGPPPSCEPHPEQLLTVGHQQAEVPAEGVDVARRDEEPLAAVVDDFVGPSCGGGNYREPEPHRLEVGNAQGLVRRRDRQQVASGQVVGDPMMGYGAQKVHVGDETETADQAPQPVNVGTVHGQAACHRQPPALGRQPTQGGDQDVQSLSREHVSDAEDTERTRHSRPRSHLGFRDLHLHVVTAGVGDDPGKGVPD